MMRSNNAGPQKPREFLAEIQHTAVEAIQQESLAQLGPTQPGTAPPEPVPTQDSAATIVALAQLGLKAQSLVMEMDLELREARRNSKELGEENKRMSLTIEALSETIAGRDATIAELNARILSLTTEKAKLRVA